MTCQNYPPQPWWETIAGAAITGILGILVICALAVVVVGAFAAIQRRKENTELAAIDAALSKLAKGDVDNA